MKIQKRGRKQEDTQKGVGCMKLQKGQEDTRK